MGISCSYIKNSSKISSPSKVTSPKYFIKKKKNYYFLYSHLKISYATSNEKRDDLFDFDVNNSFHEKDINNGAVIKEKEDQIEVALSNAV